LPSSFALYLDRNGLPQCPPVCT